ncbi:MAG: hypothetical protein P8Y25_02650, partial [Chromatiaceae bacterium]
TEWRQWGNVVWVLKKIKQPVKGIKQWYGDFAHRDTATIFWLIGRRHVIIRTTGEASTASWVSIGKAGSIG